MAIEVTGHGAHPENVFEGLIEPHAGLPGQLGEGLHDAQNCPADKVLRSVGQLTRRLHDTLVELGYHQQLQECAAATLPDARQRIAYVVTLTEQAASRSLNAVEAAIPLQEQLASDAGALAQRLDGAFGACDPSQELKVIVEATRAYLDGVQSRTDETRAHLRDIMMAQEFQDLTGQVLKRVTDLAEVLEKQLLMLLVENAPGSVKRTEAQGVLHGPTIDSANASDVVAGQGDVDALLESLGF
ncbi:MAG: protein phosphatase CheZ [Burkholderiales bacterium]